MSFLKFGILLFLLYCQVKGTTATNVTNDTTFGCDKNQTRTTNGPCDCGNVTRADWCAVCHNLWDCPTEFNCLEPSLDKCKVTHHEPASYYHSFEACGAIAHGSFSPVTLQSVDKVATEAKNAGLESIWIGASAKEYKWKWVLQNVTAAIDTQGCFIYDENADSKQFQTQQIQPVNGAQMTVYMCADICQKLGFTLIGIHQNKLTSPPKDVTNKLVCTCVHNLMTFYESASIFQCYKPCDQSDIAAGYDKCGDIDRMIVYNIQNGTTQTFTEPDGTEGSETKEQSKCVALDTDGKIWRAFKCSERFNMGHICEFPDILNETQCQLKGHSFCWLMGRCISVGVMNYTWFEADGCCFENNGHLAATRNMDFTYALIGKLSNLFDKEIYHWWIGLTNMPIVYSDGLTPAHFTGKQYGLGQPKLTVTLRCLVIKINNPTSAQNYHIEATACANPSSYMCQMDIDSCMSNPCYNGGACTDGVNSFTCSCQQGWGGLLCDKQQTTTIPGVSAEYTVSTMTQINTVSTPLNPDNSKRQTTAKVNKINSSNNRKPPPMKHIGYETIVTLVLCFVLFCGLLLMLYFVLRKYFPKLKQKFLNQTIPDTINDTSKGNNSNNNDSGHNDVVTTAGILLDTSNAVRVIQAGNEQCLKTNNTINLSMNEDSVYDEIPMYEEHPSNNTHTSTTLNSYIKLCTTPDADDTKTSGNLSFPMSKTQEQSQHPDILIHGIQGENSINDQGSSTTTSKEDAETITDILSCMIQVNGMVNTALENDLHNAKGNRNAQGTINEGFEKSTEDMTLFKACAKELERDKTEREKRSVHHTNPDNHMLLVPDVIALDVKYIQEVHSSIV